MCPDSELNLPPFDARDDASTNRAARPGPNIAFYYKLKVCGHPAFFQQHLLTVCLFVILVILTIFQVFHYHYVWRGDLWSVNFDVSVVIVLAHQEPHPYKTVNLTDQCRKCSDSSTSLPFPVCLSLSLSSVLPIPWNIPILKSGQLVMKWPFMFKEKEESHVYSWWRCWEDYWSDSKWLKILYKFHGFSHWQGLRGLTQIFEDVLLWVKQFPTASHDSWKEASTGAAKSIVVSF